MLNIYEGHSFQLSHTSPWPKREYHTPIHFCLWDCTRPIDIREGSELSMPVYLFESASNPFRVGNGFDCSSIA